MVLKIQCKFVVRLIIIIKKHGQAEKTTKTKKVCGTDYIK